MYEDSKMVIDKSAVDNIMEMDIEKGKKLIGLVLKFCNNCSGTLVKYSVYLYN